VCVSAFTAYLERANIPIQIDIGLWETLSRHIRSKTTLSTLPRINSSSFVTYPRETVVAEKLGRMVKCELPTAE